jgi:hypothetical protein
MHAKRSPCWISWSWMDPNAGMSKPLPELFHINFARYSNVIYTPSKYIQRINLTVGFSFP